MDTRRPHHTEKGGAASKTPVTAVPAAVALAAAGLAALLAALAKPRRVVVSGESMRPAFEPGDRLVVVRCRAARPGDVLAFDDPRRAGRVLLKRLSGFEGRRLVLEGDNRAASTDSRAFGAVDPGRVAGRVVYRYHPPERAGRPLGRRPPPTRSMRRWRADA